MTYYTACCKTLLAEASEGMPWQVGAPKNERARV